MKIKSTLLALILTLSIASATPADAITIFGKQLNFGKVFSTKAKTGIPVSTVIDAKYSLTPTFPKKGSVLEAGNLHTLTWKSTSPDKTVYTIKLVSLTTKKEILLGKAYEPAKVFTFFLAADTVPGKYKVVFEGKVSAESENFDILAKPILVATKLESFPGEVVSNGSAVNVAYRVTSMKDPVAPTFKITCPATISTTVNGNVERCNTVVPLSSFTQTGVTNMYNLNLAFTNKATSSDLVIMEGFIGTKSIGKVINRIDPTKAAPLFIFTYPVSNTILRVGQNSQILWKTSSTASTQYIVYLTGGTFGTNKALIGSVSGNQGSYSYAVPNAMAPGVGYRLVFVDNNGIEKASTEPFTVMHVSPFLVKVSTTATTIKNNNIDTAVMANLKMTIRADGGDIDARTITAVIGLKNSSTGSIIATSSVKGVTESGLTYFADGATKPLDFTAVFASSSFPAGITGVTTFIQSITYNPVLAARSVVYTDGLDMFTGGNATFERGGTGVIFPRNLGLGDSGDDVFKWISDSTCYEYRNKLLRA